MAVTLEDVGGVVGGSTIRGFLGISFNDDGTFKGSLSGASSISIGTNPAATGALRLANADWIKGRNAANSADLEVWRINSSNFLEYSTPLYYSNTASFSDRDAPFTLDRRETTQTATPTLRPLMWTSIMGIGDYTTPSGVTGGFFSARDGTNVFEKTVIAATNATPIEIQTSTAHGLSSGAKVGIQGVLGNTAANSTAAGGWTIVVTAADKFTLTGSVGNGAYTSGGKVSNRGYLYGLQLTVYPTFARDKVLIDDVDCLVAQHGGASGTKATDCIYIGHNSNFTAGAHEWITGVNIDANVDFAFRATGNYDYVFEAGIATIASGLLRGPNNVPSVIQRNQANTLDITLLKLDTNNNLQIVPGGQNVPLWGTYATPTTGGGQILALNSTTAGVYPELQIRYNHATGGFADFNMFGGSSTAQNLRLLCGGGKSRVYATTNTPLTLGSNNIDDVLSISGVDVTIKDTINLVLSATTGTKIGTATGQKLAFHNSTPVIQRAGAAQVAVATTAATNTTPFGFTTAAQADAIVTLVNELRAALVEKGLIKGAA